MDFKSSVLAREAMQRAKSGRHKIGGTTITNAEWARVLDKPADNNEVVVNSEVWWKDLISRPREGRLNVEHLRAYLFEYLVRLEDLFRVICVKGVSSDSFLVLHSLLYNIYLT